MEDSNQSNDEGHTALLDEQEGVEPEFGSEDETQPDEQEEKPARARRKKVPCPDCVDKHGVSTGLQSHTALCPTCDGSGSVKAVI